MERNNFFGIRTARGSSHLVVEKPARAVSPKPEAKAAKSRRPRRATAKARATKNSGSAQINVTKDLFRGDQQGQSTNTPPPDSSRDGIPDTGIQSDDYLSRVVGFFECEEISNE